MTRHGNTVTRQLARIGIVLRKLNRKGQKRRADSARLRRTCAKIEHKLSEWVQMGKHREHYPSIQRITEELDITREELNFYCHTRLHRTFYEWRKELRIREAMQLILEHRELALCEIGFVVGIPDKSNFRQQFRSIAGCTPREWRETGGHPERIGTEG